MLKQIVKVIILLGLIHSTYQYLQFQLLRIPHQSKTNVHLAKAECVSEKSQSDFKQICYDKDISYSIELYDDHEQLHLFSIDLTTPMSWMKGKNCMTTENKKCKRLEGSFKQNVKQKVGAELEDLQQKVIKKFKKKPKDEETKNTDLATIQGSSEIVKGPIQKKNNLQFWTRDSGRMTRITDLLLLGFYVLGERDKLLLSQTNFIDATSISPNINYLMDGAISLRFDENSEQSFLKQIFKYVQKGTGIEQQIVTVYIGKDHGHNNSLTIGELSIKYAQGGYSSVNWIKTTIDEDYGHTPQLNEILIANIQDEGKVKELQIAQLYAIFTLSASYISLPPKEIKKFLDSLSKYGNCSVNEQNMYVECESTNKKIENQEIIFDFETGKISLNIKDLILKKSGAKKYTLNIKQGYKQGYMIFGEPLFKKYFILFDFTKQRIGLAPLRITYNEDFINVVSLIRFVTFTFFIGCCFIICFQPVKRVINVFSGRIDRKDGPQARRLRQYSPIQQNPYEDLKGKIQDVIGNTGSGSVQGI